MKSEAAAPRVAAMSNGKAELSTAGDAAAASGRPTTVETDAESVARECLARGDRRAAVDVLMQAYGDDIYGHCHRVLRDSTLAEDVFQQVFLEAFRDLDRFEGRSTLRSWLIGVAYHRSLDAVKSRKRQRARLEDSEDAVERAVDPRDDDPGQVVDRARHVRGLEECLDRLSAETRMSVLMRYRMGLSYEEMARSSGERAGTLQARVARALPALRRCLESKGITL